MTVEDRMFRWLAVLRSVVLVNAVVLIAFRFDNAQRPGLALGATVLMVGWTAYSTWAYLEPRRRRWPLLVADLAIAVSLIAVSPVVKGAGFSATIPGFWVMGALFAWSLQWRWVGGLVAGVALAVVDLSVRQDIAQTNYGNAFLLVLGGTIVGFLVESLQLMAAQRDRAQREAVAAAERARLARAVHDGVLQVLALVQRRGAELGGDAAELGSLAGEQEAALRNLIRSQDAVGAGADVGSLDLTAALAALGARPGVEVATPGAPVELPREVAEEVVAAVGACLDNVARHVGPGAPAWVLLESFPERVQVSVRDEGSGIPDGRLDAAQAEGRLGVSGSIRGRIADLGGTARLYTGRHGTEWELSVPREAAP
jgi:signal transduction histidine kinase